MFQWIHVVPDTLVPVTARAKPLPEPIMTYCQLNPQELTSVEYQLNFPLEKRIWNVDVLRHCDRVTHIRVSNLISTGSDNGLSPGRRHIIIWNNAKMLLIGPFGTNFSEILNEIHTFSFKKMHVKMSSIKWRSFCLGLNVWNITRQGNQ